MSVPSKAQLSENDICDRFITPALVQAGWTREQHILRPGRVVVRSQASMLRAGYVLFHKSNVSLRNALIPLPPLPEQSRIVTRVTALRRLCADLRQRLAEREAVQARLAEALVQQQAFA